MNKLKAQYWLINLIAYILFTCLIVVSLLSITSAWLGWNLYLEILSHFQIQYFIVSLLILFCLVLTHHRKLIIISLFLLALNLPKILPWYWPPSAFFNHKNADLKVLVANVHNKNNNYDQVLSLVQKEDPDLAIFIEVREEWIKQLDSLKNILPYSFAQANPYDSGLVVYSNQPLINPQVNFLGTENRASIISTLIVNKQLISLIAIHPPPPVKLVWFHLRNLQLDKISQYIQTLENPVLLVGDLNTTMWSPYYQQLIKKTSLKNTRQGWGILPSWPTQSNLSPFPSWASRLLSIPIDHCLISREFQVIDTYTGSYIGSDHLPLITKLRIK